MSDVLTNLIVRSTAPVNAVRPITASLYAPDRSNVAPGDELIEQEQIIAAPPLQIEPPSSHPVGVPDQHIFVQTEQQPPRSPDVARQTEQRPRSEQHTASALDLQMLDRLVQRAVAGSPAATPAPPNQATLIERLETVRERLPAPPAERLIAPTLNDVRPAPAARNLPPEPRPVPAAAPAIVERHTERVIERVVEAAPALLPLVTPRPLPLPPLPEAPRGRTVEIIRETAAPANTPAITVSIGRIEVRAQQSAPPSRVPSPRPSVMTLDEYLRRREGGER